MITDSFYSTKLVLNRNLPKVQLQCSAIESNATSSSEFKSTVILVSLMVVSSHQSEKLSQLQTMLKAGRAGPLPVADRLELRRLVYALCHASKARGEPLHNTGRVDAAVAALKRLSDARDGLTSKRLMDLPGDARAILLSSIAFIFRDEVDEWSQIDFGNETHVEMLQASVTSSLAKLTNPKGRPVNEPLDVFFLGLRDLYQRTTGKEAVASAHRNGKPHSDFEKLMYLGYQLVRPANSYATALKAWERALERAR